MAIFPEREAQESAVSPLKIAVASAPCSRSSLTRRMSGLGNMANCNQF